MSMFRCPICQETKDADEGEFVVFKGNEVVCYDCVQERVDEDLLPDDIFGQREFAAPFPR